MHLNMPNLGLLGAQIGLFKVNMSYLWVVPLCQGNFPLGKGKLPLLQVNTRVRAQNNLKIALKQPIWAYFGPKLDYFHVF